jgi:hypothetical protein
VTAREVEERRRRAERRDHRDSHGWRVYGSRHGAED